LASNTVTRKVSRMEQHPTKHNRTLAIRLAEPLLEALEQAADKERRTVSDVARGAARGTELTSPDLGSDASAHRRKQTRYPEHFGPCR
jgi:hypothetical protein